MPGTGPVLRFLRHAGVVRCWCRIRGRGGRGAAGGVPCLAGRGAGPVAGYRALLCASRRASFLAGLAEPLDAALRRLDAGQVTSFMLGYCQGRNPESAKAMVTAMRALLRFLHVGGQTPVPAGGGGSRGGGLAAGVAAPGAGRRVVGRLLDSCDRDTVTGRRDYAILTVLARLGLRGAEAAALELADVDWRGGEVTIRGKGSRLERLPLPVPVGEAVAA